MTKSLAQMVDRLAIVGTPGHISPTCSTGELGGRQ
jgi:peroxiredoxin